MAIFLKQLAANTDPRLNLFLNKKRAAHLQDQLPHTADPTQQLHLRRRLAKERLLAGQTRQAIEQFTYVRRALAQGNYEVSNTARRQLGDWLALAQLRLGEQENCQLNHSSASCILPISTDGVHQLQEGSQEAIKEYTALLQEEPTDLGSRWLLNLAYMTLGQHPDQVPPQWLIPESAFTSDYELDRFRDVAPHLGVDAIGLSGGSSMEDFDNDGDLDLMASSWGLEDQLRHFRNEGDGTFADVTEESGLLGQLGGLNINHADYDNDGYADVLVLRGAWLHRAGLHPNSLLRNQGDGTFADVTEESGIFSLHPTHTAAWGDYDNDGDLDLFVGNETSRPRQTQEEAAFSPAETQDSRTLPLRHPCQLYQNNGDGTFIDMAAAAGVDTVGYVKGSAWGDYDSDGLIDLYVSRLGLKNVLYRNAGDGKFGWRFVDVTQKAGVAQPVESFPTWFWDYDNDGHLDLFAASFDIKSGDDIPSIYLDLPTDAAHPRLYRNKGDGTFADVTQQAGLHKVILAMAANFGDIDNDGWPDFYVGNGHPQLKALLPNVMMRNAGGRFFQDVTTSGGFGHLQKGHGISFGDIDNDGDQDIYQVMGGAYEGDVYQNVLFENPGHGNRWLTLKLEGTTSNRSAIGARIKVRVIADDKTRDIYATVGTGGSFGASSLQQEIGLGRATKIQSAAITWPATGQTQTLTDLALDTTYLIREGAAEPVPISQTRFSLSPGPVTSPHHH